MLSESARQRLEALNRAPLPAGKWRKAPPSKSKKPEVPRSTAIVVPQRLDEAVVVQNGSGEHLRITVPVDQMWKESSERIAAGYERMSRLIGETPEAPRDLSAFAAAFPRGTLFLDLETCGFAGSAIFLIGLLRQADEGLVVEQLLARNYAEERAILETLWEIAAENQVLATFNGKSFDWPMVHDRSTLHHLGRDGRIRSRRPVAEETQARLPGSPMGPRDPRPELVHFDLLHHARRR